jgi:biotin synthase
MLVKIDGTPLGDVEDLDPFEFVRTVAIARILMPASHVRLSAGRETMNDEMQALCFMGGANSIFYGEKLLTTANPEAAHDRQLFARLGINTESVQDVSDESREEAIAQSVRQQQMSSLVRDAMAPQAAEVLN